MLADLRALLLPDTVRAAFGLDASAAPAEEAEAPPPAPLETVVSVVVRSPAAALAGDVRTAAEAEPLAAQRPVGQRRSGG